MNNYLIDINEEMKEYYKILCPNFPEWLYDYINTYEMEKQGRIRLNYRNTCSNFFKIKYEYSSLNHNIGVALIIWNFTHNKKQTIAGLLQNADIPSFKNYIDFIIDEYKVQKTNQSITHNPIKNSKEIMKLLERDNIKLEEIDNCKLYPIAHTNIPKLSADEFEYTFSVGLTRFKIWDLDKIKKIYNNVTISKNENNKSELVFQNQNICEEYINTTSKMWFKWISDYNRTAMQFMIDILKSMIYKKYLTIDDFYTLSEKEIINKILNCEDEYLKTSFIKFLNSEKVYPSLEPVYDKYCVNVLPKFKYVIPLVITEKGNIRIDKLSLNSKKIIDELLSTPKGYWTYFDFDFKPYNRQKVLKKSIF